MRLILLGVAFIVVSSYCSAKVSIVNADSLVQIKNSQVAGPLMFIDTDPQGYFVNIEGYDEEEYGAMSEDERVELIQDTRANMLKNLYKHKEVEDFSKNIVVPRDNCSAFIQEINGGACYLYSALAAAINVPELREILSKMLVKQDKNFAYFMFPKPMIPKSIEHKHQKLVDASKKLYRVEKKIHTGDLLPSNDPWVNLISKAFFEYLSQAGIVSESSYDLLTIRDDGVAINLLFGTPIKVPVSDQDCIVLSDKHSASSKCKKIMVLEDSGAISLFFKRKNGKYKRKKINIENGYLVLPTNSHARTAYFNRQDGKWSFFDNQNESHGKSCGSDLKNDVESGIESSQYTQIIESPLSVKQREDQEKGQDEEGDEAQDL